MAKIEQGILGGFSGRVGMVVGYYRKGLWCVRAHVPHINDCRSAAQLEQRGRFKAMVRFAAAAVPALRLGLRRAADRAGLTEGNLFLRVNHGCFAGAAGIDYRGLRFAEGSLPGVEDAVYEVDVDGLTVSVAWSRGRGRGDDRVVVYAYCPALGRGLALEGQRRCKSLRFMLPDEWRGCGLQLWCFAAGAAGEVSASQYVQPKASDGDNRLDDSASAQVDEQVFRLGADAVLGAPDAEAGGDADGGLPFAEGAPRALV